MHCQYLNIDFKIASYTRVFSKPLFTMFGGSERSGTGLMLMTADKRDAAEYANRKLFCEKTGTYTGTAELH